MPQIIPLEVKQKCCAMKNGGMVTRDIYDQYFSKQFSEPQSYTSFERSLLRWAKKVYPDDLTLRSGTYHGFTAHNATVQVSRDGEIVQAWVKQKANDMDPEQFIDAIKEVVEPYRFEVCQLDDACDMLEIPLFDMHWGVAFMDYYSRLLDDILKIIHRKHWARIVIPFGQDFFHNDSIVKGITTNGTVIEKVDMVRAVKESKQFMYTLISSCIEHSNSTSVIYSPGNHDRSISWMFMQTLLERYGPDVIDDSLAFRKVITHGQVSVMITHGNSKRASTASNLAHIFRSEFRESLTKAIVSEVHAGHLHTESDTDVFGIMVRRLSSGNKTDEWSDLNDFIGSNKRFMLFEWGLDRLKSICYL